MHHLVGHLELLIIGGKGGVGLEQFAAMTVDVAQTGIDDDALGHQLAVELGVLQGVEGHKDIGHDAAATINRAVELEGVILERVVEMDAVGMGQLAVLEPVVKILGIVFTVAFLIGFLDASS